MTDVRITRDVPGGTAAVFRAFTEADLLRTWWWPHLPDATYAVDPVAGGEIAIASAAAGIGFHGTFTEVTAPTRLAFTWIWVDDLETDRVKVVLSALTPDTTRAVVTHTCSADAAAGLEQGWGDVLDRLAARPPEQGGTRHG
jgi:uncharacterized protein YndB with AHSA1/START domain